MVKKVLHITTRIMLRLLLTFAVVILLVVVALQFHWVQQKIIHAATSYISDKTHTRVEVDRIAISFPKNIVLKKVFVEDRQHDTLLAVTELSVGVDMMALFEGKVMVSDLTLSGTTCRIHRTLPDSAFNFDFLIDVFVSSETPEEVTPETPASSESSPIKVGKLVLKDIRFTYDDAITGVYTENNVGELTVNDGVVDLTRFSFTINELYLANTRSVVELKPVPPSPDEPEDTSALPYFAANKIVCHAVDFAFSAPADLLFLNTHVGELELIPQRVDLNKQQIDIRSLVVKHSDFHLKMFEQPEQQPTGLPEDTTPVGWTVSAGKVVMEENAFGYDVTNLVKLTKGFDYNHIDASHITMDARSLFYSDEGIRGEVKNLKVTEQSGIVVERLRTHFSYDDQHAELANLYLQTAHSKITKSLKVTYPSVASMAEHPENIGLDFYFDDTRIDMRDVLVFAPELETDPMLKKYARQQVVLNGGMTGKVSNLHLKNLIAQTATQTAITLNGNIKGLPDVNALWVDMHIPLLATTRNDLNGLLPDSTIPSMVTLPQKMVVKGHVKGSLKDLQSNLLFQTSEGSAKLVAAYKMEDTIPVYDITLQPTQLDIGAITQQPSVGKVTGVLKVNGRSFNPKEMVATLTSKWSLIELKQYAYTDLVLDASANLGILQSQLVVNDKNVDLKAKLDASIHPKTSYAVLSMSLAGANLREINLSHDPFKMSGELKANLYGIVDEKLVGNVGIGDVLVITPKQQYVLDSMLVVSLNEKRKEIKADVMLKVRYDGETQLQSMPAVLQQYISQYWGKPITERNMQHEGFTCAIKVTSHPILTDLIVPELGQFYGADVQADYNGKDNSISVTANAPYIEYGQTQVNNFQMKVNSRGDSLMYQTSLQSITSGSFFVDRMSLKGSISHHFLRYDLSIIDPDSGYKFKVGGQVHRDGDSLILRWLNEHIVLNNERWDIDKENSIVIAPAGMNIRRFSLTHGKEFIKMNSTRPGLNAPLNIAFGDFDLAILSQMVEKDSAIVEGMLNGTIELNPAENFAFTSDLTIKQIALHEVPVGTLYINANNQKGGRYNATMKLTGNENEATIDGFYQNNELSFKVNVVRIKVQSIEAFIPQTIKRSTGYITGHLIVSGKADHPVFNGDIGLKEASFNVAFVNNRLSFNDEHILLNNEGIRFEKFTVLDSMQQPLVIDGFIHTTNFVNMRYDLHITTKNFRVLNTTAKDNPEYYGVIILNSTISVKGTEKLPQVNADVSLLNGSDITYVVQQGELSIDKGEGVVVFIDTSVNAIMKDTSAPMVSSFVGLDITASIEVNKNTRFKIITDAESGDNLMVSGDARLSFGIDESGKISLVGAYVLSSGSYKASLQKIAKREFDIKPGSTITWSGDPLDAVIDITAIYKVRAGATDLLAAELAGMDEGVRNQYRKLLNYDVELIVKGFLSDPAPTFHLDMAPKDQLAFGGEVYNKINQINNNPVELNKQVFSLLIWGRFIPMGTGSNMTATDAAATLARNSVNQLFSDQLNSLSGKYIKGAELNFNIQANDNYSETGATQQSTEVQIGLKKELFNNRVSVQVGSNIDVGAAASQGQAQTITGDMLMEYKITEDGTYRFKAFTENSYEGVIDGQVYKTGIGFMYSKDFDSISQLFARPKKEEKLKTNDEKAD